MNFLIFSYQTGSGGPAGLIIFFYFILLIVVPFAIAVFFTARNFYKAKQNKKNKEKTMKSIEKSEKCC